MTDWHSLPFAIDVSHHNGVIDWDKVAARRPACVFLKATEQRWTSPSFERNRMACEDRGILWVPYVFLRPDDDDRTFKYLIELIADKTIPVAIDWEEPEGPGTNPVAARVVEDWITALESGSGRTPIAYYGLYPPDAPTEKIGRCPRWYPQYPGSPTAAPRLPMWDGRPGEVDWRKQWLIWQWSDKGNVHGVSGNVDLNRLACSAEVFANWYRTGVLTPSVPAREPATPVIHSPVRLGDRGDTVRDLQRRLTAKGFDVGPVDGSYGKRTDAAFWAWVWTELTR